MLVRIGFFAITLLCGISVGKELLLNQSDARYLSIRYVDEGAETKVLAKHTLRLRKDGTIDFTAGGETIPHDDEPSLSFGTQITGELESIENDSYRASIKLKIGNLVECGDAATQLVRSECFELRTELEVGKDSRIPCGEDRWIELRVDN